MGKRILIADDSVTIQKAFAMTLTGEDFAITAARSADEGLTLARQARPDVVIADASMPGRSGYELCAALKADAALRAVPVYILSSLQQPFDEAKGRQVGAAGTLTKPWESGALIEKLKEATGRGAVPIARAAASLPTAAFDNDISMEIERPRDMSPSAPRPSATAMPAVRPPGPPVAAPVGGLRPSLIPGMRPGAMPPARPGTSPSRTLGATSPLPSSSVPPRPAAAAVGRTLFGLPAASMPFPGAPRPVPASVTPAHAPTPAAMMAAAPATVPMPIPAHVAAPAPAGDPMHARTSPSPVMAAHIGSAVDQKVAAIAARGPEYEALAKLSREVIEQIVWEIVPELAELIIREQMEKRGRS